MGTTSIAANMNDKVIDVAYYRDIDLGESTVPVDLSVTIKHQYVTSASTAQEIVLEQFVIGKDYLETVGLMGASEVEQKVEFHVTNLRYIENIFIELQEVRDSVPVFTRVPVLASDDETVEPLPNNPKHYLGYDEIPEVTPVQDRNISIESTDIGVLYKMLATDLVASQISKRIFLLEENGEQVFIQQDYNESISQIFIENSITNLLPNPQFLGADDIPTSWEIDAPGITLNSYLLPGPIASTNSWKIRASNTNVFNAFNSVTLKTINTNDLYSGLGALTFSIYYKLICYTSNIPFNNWTLKINFFFNTEFIRFEEIISTVSSDMNIFKLLVFTLQGVQIPLTANKYSLELSIADIDRTDLFDLEFYLPQLEGLSCATTRTLDTRIEDKYVTGTTFVLDLPFYLYVKTYHVTGPGIRGLFSSTTEQKNGFEFLSSNDRLRFKFYDVVGNLQLNIASDVIPTSIQANALVEYGFRITSSVLEFYINNFLLSTHANTISINQDQFYVVGSLEKSNTTINSELLDVKILRDRF